MSGQGIQVAESQVRASDKRARAAIQQLSLEVVKGVCAVTPDPDDHVFTAYLDGSSEASAGIEYGLDAPIAGDVVLVAKGPLRGRRFLLAIVSRQRSSSDFLNPMLDVGDLIIGSTLGAPARLAAASGLTTPMLTVNQTTKLISWIEAPAGSGGGAHPDLATHDTLGLATQGELDTHAATPHGGGGVHPDLTAHDTLGLATQAELDTHATAADPHAGYQIESGRNAASSLVSYPGLDNDASARVPAARLATGTADATTFLRGDRTWQVVAAGGGPAYGRQAVNLVVSSTTVWGSSDLTFPIGANESWGIIVVGIYNTAAITTGLKLGFDAPAGCLIRCQFGQFTTAVAKTLGIIDVIKAGTFVRPSVANQARAFDIHGFVNNGATAGTITMQILSEVAASNATLVAGSWMQFVRIA